jgi:hypothetical protein
MSKITTLAHGAALAAALAASFVGVTPAVAQQYGPPPGYSPGYAYGDPDAPPPEGYDDSYGRYDSSDRAREEDRRYADSVQRWAEQNCVDQRNHDAAAGAVIGGILGAIIGSNVAGRGNHTGGAIVGGALGAMAGSAIGASNSSPGCPPGYVVREGASPFSSGVVFYGGYGYAAPPGYRPWIWTGGRWAYRPYPYHRYYDRYEQQHRYRSDDWEARNRR